MRISASFLMCVALAAPVAAQNTAPNPVQSATQAANRAVAQSATHAAAQTAAEVAAQPPAPGQVQHTQPPPAATVIAAGEPKLVFEREIYSYPGRARRDPFKALTSTVGPLFEDLKINIILFSPNPANSVVLLSDTERKEYRLRRGETVGNATVVEIRETRVIFSVNDFGIRRQGILELKAKREGA